MAFLVRRGKATSVKDEGEPPHPCPEQGTPLSFHLLKEVGFQRRRYDESIWLKPAKPLRLGLIEDVPES